ncbi:MAG: hypothetical protein DRQ13_04930 [Ignavibacteriae bacterium]|nr:MAG: hypothetical protein DRQ13_04930 [Ignavibacteriota bacterium]
MYFTATYDGQTTIYESIMLIDENGDPVSVERENETEMIPKEILLYPAYPNPFNPTTTIKFTIPSVDTHDRMSVRLIVYDLLGKEVATLLNQEKPAGEYELEFNADKYNLSSGTYIIVLNTLGAFITRKVLLIK